MRKTRFIWCKLEVIFVVVDCVCVGVCAYVCAGYVSKQLDLFPDIMP